MHSQALRLSHKVCSNVNNNVIQRSVSRVVGLHPLPQKVRFILSNGATVSRWAPYPAGYHTVPMDDDVFNYRDFSKIPLYMQSATLYDIRKYGVDDDFTTTLQSRLEKKKQIDKDNVKKRKESKIYRREQAVLAEQARKEEESAANAVVAAERAREEALKKKKREKEEESIVQRGGGVEALKKLAAEQAKANAKANLAKKK